MTLENAIKKAREYSDKDLPFSELKYRKLIYAKTNKAKHQLWYANALRLCGYYKLSEETYSSILIKQIPKEYHYDFYLQFGLLYMDAGNLKLALDFFLKSFRLNKERTSIYVFISCILKTQEKDKQAISYLKRALEKEGDIDEVNYNLATAYIRIGKLDNAYKAIIDCVRIDPKYPNAKKIKRDIETLLKLPQTLEIDY